MMERGLCSENFEVSVPGDDLEKQTENEKIRLKFWIEALDFFLSVLALVCW